MVRDRKIRTALRTNQIVGFVTVPAWKQKKNKTKRYLSELCNSRCQWIRILAFLYDIMTLYSKNWFHHKQYLTVVEFSISHFRTRNQTGTFFTRLCMKRPEWYQETTHFKMSSARFHRAFLESGLRSFPRSLRGRARGPLSRTAAANQA